MLPAGERDRTIYLQQRISDKDSGAASVQNYKPLATVRAKYNPISGDEKKIGAGMTPQVEAEFTILYSSDSKQLRAKDRVLFEDRPWDVLEVRELGRREELLIKARLTNANR